MNNASFDIRTKKWKRFGFMNWWSEMKKTKWIWQEQIIISLNRWNCCVLAFFCPEIAKYVLGTFCIEIDLWINHSRTLWPSICSVIHTLVVSFRFIQYVTDLDHQREMIIFESYLTTFEASIIFWGRRGSSKNWLEPHTKTPWPSLTKPSLSKSSVGTNEREGSRGVAVLNTLLRPESLKHCWERWCIFGTTVHNLCLT